MLGIAARSAEISLVLASLRTPKSKLMSSTTLWRRAIVSCIIKGVVGIRLVYHVYSCMVPFCL